MADRKVNHRASRQRTSQLGEYLAAAAIRASYMGGLPIPGRTVPILRLFEHYGASCRPRSRKDFGMDQLAEIMSSLNAEEVAKKVYHQLFHSMGDVQLEKLMGKWYT
ncbi:hypothetical protein TELCIR_18958, partial [Teladorsagia circumcincta]